MSRLFPGQRLRVNCVLAIGRPERLTLADITRLLALDRRRPPSASEYDRKPFWVTNRYISLADVETCLKN